MDVILENLMEVDRRARAIVEEGEEYLETTIANMERDVAEYKESYAQRARHRVGVVRDQEDEASRQAAEDITNRYHQLMEHLEKTHRENHTGWEDEIFQKCIEG